MSGRFGGRVSLVTDGVSGTGRPAKLTTECAEEEFDCTIAINLTDVWLRMKYEILHIRHHGSTSIVNTASAAEVFQPFPTTSRVSLVSWD